MTNTANLGLPFIDAGQAQKHVTHNDALRILDAAVQISVLDLTRTTPPPSPAEGERHIVAAGATGAWAGHASAIATWQDGAWAFLAARVGWCVWSVTDNVVYVYDGTQWRDLRILPTALDNVARVGINTTATAPNLLSVKSNAALLAAITAASGGSGDVRLQLSKETIANVASVYFADSFSGRAEFGLVGSDAFKLKVSPDGVNWIEAFTVDQATGNLALPRGLAMSGVIAPAQITANQNDYVPTGLASASVLQISSDAARNITGLGNGAEGRILCVINVGGQPITLLDESASSSAVNRFTLGCNLTIAAKQAVILRYDATAARWQGITGGLTLRADAAQSLTATQKKQAQANAYVPRTVSSVSPASHSGGFSANGAGTYTPPAGCLAIEVLMWGPGAGGSGSGTSSPSGNAGSADTTFGSMIAAKGGAPSGLTGGAGGGVSGVIGAQISAVAGMDGTDAVFGSVLHGGQGGSSALGGGGKSGSLSNTGSSAKAGTGAGGGGGGAIFGNSSTSGGGGGGAGGCIRTLITTPAVNYSYSVGTKGAGGIAGGSGRAGGDGDDGGIVVVEFYGS